MEELKRFSPEVIKQLGCYVYRLIDPRDGQTFYVGKGKGNRIFAHVYDALKHYEGESYETEADDIDNTKLNRIREIKRAGLNVIHVIQRWGMDDETAFQVEAALIDCYAGLSNAVAGHGNEYGVSNALELERRLSLKVYDEPKFKYMIIKTTQERIESDFCKDKPDPLYEATRSAWKVNPDRAERYPYIFSVINGVVKAVYEVEYWEPADNREKRYQFIGHPAPEEICCQVVGMRIPEYYSKKGMAAPFLYSKEQMD